MGIGSWYHSARQRGEKGSRVWNGESDRKNNRDKEIEGETDRDKKRE